MQSSRTKLIIAENEVDTPKDISNVSSIEKLEPAIFKNVGPLPMADAVRVVDRDNNRMGGSFGHEMLASIDDYSHVAMWQVQISENELNPEDQTGKSNPTEVLATEANLTSFEPPQIDEKPEQNSGCFNFIWDFSVAGLVLGKGVSGFHRGALLAMMFVSLQCSMLICPFIIELDFEFYYAGLLAAVIVSPLDALVSVVIMSVKEAVMAFKIILYVILFGLQAAALGLTWFFSDDYGETMNNDWMLAAGVAAGTLLVVIHPITLAVKYGIYTCQGKPYYD